MATIVTRAGKGSALTHTELDANFTNLNDDKPDLTGTPVSGNVPKFNGTGNDLTDAGYSFSGLVGDTALTKAEFDILDGALVTTAQLNYNTITTLGTVEASKVVTADVNKDVIGLNNVTSTAFTGNVTGNVTGNLTGDVTGNLTGNVTGNLTGDVTGNLSGTASNITGQGALATLNTVASAQIDADSVGDSELKTAASTRTQTTLASNSSWVIPVGFYNIVVSTSGSSNGSLEIRIGTTWRASTSLAFNGFIWSDGTNMRITNNNLSDSATIYYQKLG